MNHGKIVTLTLAALVSACQANSPSAPSPEAADSTSDSEQASAPSLTSGAQPAPTIPADQHQPHPEGGSGTSLCALDETVLFSCKIKRSEKVASLCASKDVAEAKGHLYYAYGTPQRKELVFPADKHPPAKRFKRTQLGFAGNTGGYAYSFKNEDRQYIVYSVSGANGLEDQGVMVTRGDARKPDTVMACQQGSVVEDDDDVLLDFVLGWDHDPVIEKQGLPARD